MVEFVLAMVAGIIFFISAITQILHMARTKSAEGVSKAFAGFLTLGIFCTFILTILGDNSIWYVIERASGVVTFAIIFYLSVYYKQ